MPKIQRETQKIFCNSAESDQLAVFGSMATGTPDYSNNIEELQNNEAFDLGWDAATLEDKAPFMEEMNGMQYGITKQLAYNFQEGIPEYDAGTTYYIGSIVKVLEENKPVLYTSLTDENLGNNPITDATNWERLSFGGGGLELGDIGFTQMAIDESKGKRRVLNGQLIIQDQYVQFTNIVKNSVTLNPDLACTEEEWQTAVTMSEAGICYKFVIDDDAGTIRLPKYPSYFIGGVDDIAPVAGNGMTLGLDNGKNFGFVTTQNATVNSYQYYTGAYGTNKGLYFVNGDSGSGRMSDKNGYTVGVTTDSTKSGIEAQIKQEKIKGTYFIQVATGAEIEDNIVNEIELNNPFSLLDYKYSEYELNNLSWLRSNSQWNSKAVYPAVYELLLKIYNGTETKAGVSVKLTTETFTDYDFVLNTAEETFRLPVKVKLASGKAVVGNGIALGLTDGVQSQSLAMSININAQRLNYGELGALIGSSTGTNWTDSKTVGVVTDPTKSGIETSDSDLYLYFYVGETVQNANLINAGRIEEKLSNLIPDNSSLISSYSMPSGRYIDLAVGANESTYTAPADGWFFAQNNTTGTAGLTLYNDTKGYFMGNCVERAWAIPVLLPCQKNDLVKLSCWNQMNIVTFRFYYLEGDQ